jgi:hypothetical protein
MALIVCPLCVREDDIFLVQTLPDGRKEARCDDCDFTFTYGKAVEEPMAAPAKPKASAATRSRQKTTTAKRTAARTNVPPLQVALKQFQASIEIDAAAMARAHDLRAEFLQSVDFEVPPAVANHWRKFGWVFSPDGIGKVVAFDLQQFVHDRTGGDVGSVADFDKAWLLLGENESARRMRASIEHVLRGAGYAEDRLSAVLDGTFEQAMPGLSEAVVVKILSIGDLDRYLPVLTYARKRELAASVYNINLPSADVGSWTLGRLAVWSNNLLLELLGTGFHDNHHAAEFLRWADAKLQA